MNRQSVILLFVLAVCALPVQAASVDNFMLLDQKGKAHELYYYSDAKLIVMMVQGNGCPIVRAVWSDYDKIRQSYADRGVEFMMINSNLQDTRQTILDEAEEYGFDIPILVDETQVIGESLDLVRTAEVLVINPHNWELVYRGPVNDRVTFERQLEGASENYLSDTLDTLLADSDAELAVAERLNVGCLINFPERAADHSSISYTDTIAPLLQENCVECHQPGGIGPWAMTSYDMVRGFAPMIREVVRTGRMPPWHADPHIGTWESDRGLSVEEVQTLVHWVEAGAPRGDGADLLAQEVSEAPAWPLGEPDLVIDIPAYEIPATGVIEYKYPVVKNPLTHGVWVKAVSVAPGDRSVVHHVLGGASDPTKPMKGQSLFDNYLIAYAPGNESAFMPEGTGVYIPPGGDFILQMHYTPVGKPAVDQTRVGLYFHDEPPGNFLRHHVILDPTIKVPANAKNWGKSGYFDFERDAVLYEVLPHAHFRGKSATFTLRYPDGNEELLLSVPKYDFNWQRSYTFAEPQQIPAGSRLIYHSVYDNSGQNPGNPDPDREVPWGQQSFDEMLYGDVLFAWKDETSAEPIHDNDRMAAAQVFGFADHNQDTIWQWDEMSPKMQEELADNFARIDQDGDGGLNLDEYLQMRADQAKQQNSTGGN